MADVLLEARDLTKNYPITKGLLQRTVGYVRAIDGVSFTVERGKTLSLVGFLLDLARQVASRLQV